MVTLNRSGTGCRSWEQVKGVSWVVESLFDSDVGHDVYVLLLFPFSVFLSSSHLPSFGYQIWTFLSSVSTAAVTSFLS